MIINSEIEILIFEINTYLRFYVTGSSKNPNRISYIGIKTA